MNRKKCFSRLGTKGPGEDPISTYVYTYVYTYLYTYVYTYVYSRVVLIRASGGRGEGGMWREEMGEED